MRSRSVIWSSHPARSCGGFTSPFFFLSGHHAVASVGASRCELTWSGEFEPKGIGDDEAIEATKSMYRYGISLMEKTIARAKRDQ